MQNAQNQDFDLIRTATRKGYIYSVSLNGKEVLTRTTARDYGFAVVWESAHPGNNTSDTHAASFAARLDLAQAAAKNGGVIVKLSATHEAPAPKREPKAQAGFEGYVERKAVENKEEYNRLSALIRDNTAAYEEANNGADRNEKMKAYWDAYNDANFGLTFTLRELAACGLKVGDLVRMEYTYRGVERPVFQVVETTHKQSKKPAIRLQQMKGPNKPSNVIVEIHGFRAQLRNFAVVLELPGSQEPTEAPVDAVSVSPEPTAAPATSQEQPAGLAGGVGRSTGSRAADWPLLTSTPLAPADTLPGYSYSAKDALSWVLIYGLRDAALPVETKELLAGMVEPAETLLVEALIQRQDREQLLKALRLGYETLRVMEANRVAFPPAVLIKRLRIGAYLEAGAPPDRVEETPELEEQLKPLRELIMTGKAEAIFAPGKDWHREPVDLGRGVGVSQEPPQVNGAVISGAWFDEASKLPLTFTPRGIGAVGELLMSGPKRTDLQRAAYGLQQALLELNLASGAAGASGAAYLIGEAIERNRGEAELYEFARHGAELIRHYAPETRALMDWGAYVEANPKARLSAAVIHLLSCLQLLGLTSAVTRLSQAGRGFNADRETQPPLRRLLEQGADAVALLNRKVNAKTPKQTVEAVGVALELWREAVLVAPLEEETDEQEQPAPEEAADPAGAGYDWPLSAYLIAAQKLTEAAEYLQSYGARFPTVEAPLNVLERLNMLLYHFNGDLRPIEEKTAELMKAGQDLWIACIAADRHRERWGKEHDAWLATYSVSQIPARRTGPRPFEPAPKERLQELYQAYVAAARNSEAKAAPATGVHLGNVTKAGQARAEAVRTRILYNEALFGVKAGSMVEMELEGERVLGFTVADEDGRLCFGRYLNSGEPGKRRFYFSAGDKVLKEAVILPE